MKVVLFLALFLIKATISLNLDLITELLDSDMIDLTNLFNESATNSTEPLDIISE